MTARALIRRTTSWGSLVPDPDLHVLQERSQFTWCALRRRTDRDLILDPMPDVLPEKMRWCPVCIGCLAREYNLIDDIAASLAGYDARLR
jgi:hypothetical protein